MMTLPGQEQDLRKRLAAAQKRLAELSVDPAEPLFRNRVYPVDIPLPLATDTVAFGEISIDQGVTFYCKGIEAVYSVSGLLSEDEETPASMSLSSSARPFVFDYTWNIRDNSTDRDWGNLALPSAVMITGNVNGNRFQRGQSRLRGGAVITVTINPIFFAPTSVVSGLTEITEHSLQVVLSGIQIKDGAL